MRTYGNEIMVQRGETFTIDKLVRTSNGDPYIVSSELRNPYLVLTVSSSEHAQNNRYIHNYWLKGFRTFYLTRPVNLKSILNAKNGIPKYPNGFDDITSLNDDGEGGLYLVSGYYNGLDTMFYPSDAVFYVEDSSGNKEYKYWDVEADDWMEYKFRIVKTFLHTDTENWVPQNYVWSIQLVAGQDTMSYLIELCDEAFIDYEPYEGNTDIEKHQYMENLHRMLLEAGIKFPEKFSVRQPLAYLEKSDVILPPSKLSVLPTSRGVLI